MWWFLMDLGDRSVALDPWGAHADNAHSGVVVVSVGIDLGSAFVHVAWMEDGGVRWRGAAPTAGRPLHALAGLIDRLQTEVKPPPCVVGITGMGRHLLADRCPDAVPANEVVASARGAAALCPEARCAIEIGGKTSRWMALHPDCGGDVVDFALSDLCAAGAGSFLEQQAGRMKLTVPELAALATQARRGAAVAGRCAVFAKSDMIHLQQKGTPPSEIAYGLCLALARNFQARVLRGRPLLLPVALLGGCTANAGLVHALKEVLDLDDDTALLPEDAAWAGAVGAALLAANGATVSLLDLRQAVSEEWASDGGLSRLPPLPSPGVGESPPEPDGSLIGSCGVYMGVDVGSVSTDLALLTPDGVVVDAVYLPTRGSPLDVLQEAMAILTERHGMFLDVLGVGTTGSGRHLAGRFLGADLVRNEISAQLRSAAAAYPEVDTVLEIGGQDSKYIHAKDGHIVDFTMNKICAAGTGSFLEEQAERLGVSIFGEFAELALSSNAPPDLGRRCTVFMESALVHALQQGASTADVAAGLALSVVRNYLDRVVAGRPIGENVLFQGGTASNRAVVSAFQQVLGRPIRVHPHNRISGAIGAALLVMDAKADGRLGEGTAFRGLNACHGTLDRSLVCKHCANRCQVNRIRSGDEIFYFGDVCERWTTQGRVIDAPPPENDPVTRRNRLLLHHAGLPDTEAVPTFDPNRAVGIPRASMTFSLLPLWTALVRASGREPVLSAANSPQVLERGLRHLPAETCLPVKMMCGQVRDLAERGVRTILLPSVVTLPPTQPDHDRTDVCPYVQHLPYMVRGSVDATFWSPEVWLDRPPDKVFHDPTQAARDLGLTPERLADAVREGTAAQERLREDLLALGREVLAEADDRVVVLIGKPYNVADPFLNLNLALHLNRLGFPALPMECLPLHEVTLSDRWFDLPWALNRDQVRSALIVREDPRMFPIVVSSFGCGPDAFTAKHLEHLLEGRPRLVLEMDEHRAEAGLITRLEAFADEVDAWIRRPRHSPRPAPHVHAARSTPRTYLPYIADHAHAFAGALRRRGREVVMLPPPDDEVLQIGESLASGRECHPYALLVGDAARLARDGDLRPGDTFHYPSTILPCLLMQYRDGIRYALRRLGVEGVKVETTDFRNSQKAYGTRGALRLVTANALTDLLIRAACETRPYALEPYQVDEVHQRTVRRLGRAVERGSLRGVVEDGLVALSAVPVDRSTPRPVVGVAGDLYTRINDFASGDLFARLEGMGCEVWPAPFGTDVVYFNAHRNLRRSLAERHPKQASTSALFLSLHRLHMGWCGRAFQGLLRDRPEPDFREVHRLAGPYVGPCGSPLVLLNVSKMVHFARGGACGVLNAACFNCMIGSVSAAVMERLRADHDDVPMANLVHGGTAGTTDTARLEAFVHQVHRHHARRASEEEH